MSAISGVIDLRQHQLTQNYEYRWKQAFSKYAIDSYHCITQDNLFLSCALQYFNQESRQECLPVFDEESMIFFTADCVLDQREQLIQELLSTGKCTASASCADGWLILQAYKCWGTSCVQHLRGVFAFAVYDRKENQVFLFSDQFACRSLFFHMRDGILYFSTTLFSLRDISGLSFEENERWLVDCITLRGPSIMIEPRECAYQNVYKVEAGHYVSVNLSGFTYHTYFDPRKTVKTNHKITDEECTMELRRLLNASVKSCIRTDGNVGIKLSSGLDSSTIAGFAAPLLNENGKNLFSYTSIPRKDSIYRKQAFYIDDETDGVLEICRQYPNIRPHFLDAVQQDTENQDESEVTGKNILNQAEHILDIWQLPCKSQQNAVWVDEIYHAGKADACKILLSGATGNTTLSAGRLEDYIADLIRHFHIRRAWQDYRYFMKKNGGHSGRFAKAVVKKQLGYYRKKLLPFRADYYEMGITQKTLGEKHQLTRRFFGNVYDINPLRSRQTMKDEAYLPIAYAQIGELETNMSLSYGILERDPLRNVEFILFCQALPMRCFVSRDYDRRLVREFLRGIVPESICRDMHHRGRQSADNAYRISLSWEKYVPQINRELNSPKAQHYLDPQRISKFQDGLCKENLIEREMDMRMMVDAYLFLKYLNRL